MRFLTAYSVLFFLVALQGCAGSAKREHSQKKPDLISQRQSAPLKKPPVAQKKKAAASAAISQGKWPSSRFIPPLPVPTATAMGEPEGMWPMLFRSLAIPIAATIFLIMALILLVEWAAYRSEKNKSPGKENGRKEDSQNSLPKAS